MTDFTSQLKTFLDNNVIRGFNQENSPFPYMDKNGNELKTSNGIPIVSIYNIFFVDKDLNIYFLATNMNTFFYDENEYYMWIKIGDETFKEHQFYTKEGYKIEGTNIDNMDKYHDTTFFNVKVKKKDNTRTEVVIKLKNPEWELIKTNLGTTLMHIRHVIKYKEMKYQNINIYNGRIGEGKEVPLLKYDGIDEFIEVNLYYQSRFLKLHPLSVDRDFLKTRINGKLEFCKVDDKGDVYTTDGKYLGKLIIEKIDNKLETINIKTGWFNTFNIYRISDYIKLNGIDGRQFYKAMNNNSKVAWFEKGLEKNYISIRNLWFDDVSDIYYDEETQNYYYDAKLGGQKTAIKFLSNEMKEIFDKANILLEKAEKMEKNRQKLEEIQKKREQKLKELQELTKVTEKIHSEIHDDFQDIKEINDHKGGLIVQLHDEISDQIKSIYDN